ncbi:MAG: hypothetical protein U0U67_15435 [Chitinophagales bacterium]
MKKTTFLFIILLCCFSVSFAQEIHIINSVAKNTNYIDPLNNEKNLLFRFVLDFPAIAASEISEKESYLTMAITLYENGVPVKTAAGYSSLANYKTGNYQKINSSFDLRYSTQDILIQLKTLDLPEGEHNLTARFKLYKYGYAKNKVYQSFELNNIIINQPKTLKLLDAPAKQLTLFRDIEIRTDVNYEASNGIEISYEYNNNENEGQYSYINDQFYKESYYVYVTLFENNKPIKAIPNYKDITNEYGNIRIIEPISRFYPRDKLKPTFIPYAALKLSEGKHVITAKFEVICQKSEANKFHQKIEKQNINFNKPATQTVSLGIEYIVVGNKYFKDGFWDLDKPSPDIEVLVFSGNTLIWNKKSYDNYTFTNSSSTKNISYTISKGDAINIHLVDLDILFNDYIGEIFVKLSDDDIGKVHTANKYDDAVAVRGQIIDYKLNWIIK